MDINAKETKLHIKKADVIVMIVCILAAVVLAVGFGGSHKEGRMLRISYDGVIILTVELEEGIFSEKESFATGQNDSYYLITYEEDEARLVKYEECPAIVTDSSYNLVHILATGVQMEAADCRDQICVHHRPIKGGGESIICLPHRLVVEVTGNEPDEAVDGMVK